MRLPNFEVLASRVVLAVALLSLVAGPGCGSDSGGTGGSPDAVEAVDTPAADAPSATDVIAGTDTPGPDDVAPTPDTGEGDDVPALVDAAAPADAASDLATPPDAAPDLATPEDVPADVTVAPHIAWGACPDYIALAPGFECAFVLVPLDPAQPDGVTIDVFVYRLPATRTEGKRQVWFLQGGPGGSGAAFAQLFALYTRVHPEWELLSLDHRGVGNTARLTCAAERRPGSFDAAACAAELTATWGAAGLGQFTTTNAARDVGHVVELAREPGVPVFVYGASYGTYWGLRYLQLFPEQAEGVILDSICSPGACHLDEYDENFNENGRLLMGDCAADPTCAAKLASVAATPWDAVADVFAGLDDGTLCGGQLRGQLDRPTLRLVLAMLEMDFSMRVVVPALVYRLARCSDDDLEVLSYFYQTLQYFMGGGMSGAPELAGPAFVSEERLDASMTLGSHIIAAELLGTRTYDEVRAIADAAYFSPDASPEMVRVVESGAWPVYPDDGYVNRWPETARPLLLLNGTRDPQTTLAMAQPTADYFTGDHQTFVALPGAPHGVTITSQTEESVAGYLSGTEDGMVDYVTKTCGFRMLEAFVADPTAPVDTSCVDAVYPLEFGTASELNRAMSQMLLGTEDMYEGSVAWKGVAPRLPLGWNPLNPRSPRGR